MVSILVPSFNSATYLPQLCQSLQAQTYQNFEILILDDGSTDDTARALAPFRGDPHFRIFGWTPNRGVNAATSALLGLMKGDYWCNPGADDVLHPDFVAKRLDRLESSPEAAMVHGPAEIIDASGQPRKDDFPRLELPAKMDGKRALAVLLQHDIVGTSSVLVRSDITRLILPFFLCRWKYAPDWHLWLLHAATGFDLLWDERCLHKYRVHDQSLSNTPHYNTVRSAEIRLVPLCALSAAAQFSPLAADQWSKWRKTLYRAWLLRAVNLQAEGTLQEDWLQLAGHAYYGKNAGRISLFQELCRHALGMPLTRLKEQHAIKQQSFRVSGIAQINDPIFR